MIRVSEVGNEVKTSIFSLPQLYCSIKDSSSMEALKFCSSLRKSKNYVMMDVRVRSAHEISPVLANGNAVLCSC